ncbi:MAG TPA: hypothetical protein VFH03_10170 [Actinoplanes sp.]|nr:hypothetical protein [Actinoplanes sp.]
MARRRQLLRTRLELIVWLGAAAVIAVLTVISFAMLGKDVAGIVAAVLIGIWAALPAIFTWVGRMRRGDEFHVSAAVRQPPLGYLGRLDGEHPVGAVSYSPYPFQVTWPELTIRVSNESARSHDISALVFDIKRSSPDLSCVPVIADVSRPPRTVRLLNEGWGTVGAGRLQIHFRSVTGAAIGDPWEVDVPPFTSVHQLDLGPGMAERGADVPALQAVERHRTKYTAKGVFVEQNGRWIPSAQHHEQVRAASGPFAYGVAAISGEWRFAGCADDGTPREQCLRFTLDKIHIHGTSTGNFPLSADVPSPQLQLRTTGDSYAVRHEVHETIPPNAAFEVSLTLGAPASSVHTLSIKAETDAGTTASSRDLTIRVVVPRTSRDISILRGR